MKISVGYQVLVYDKWWTIYNIVPVRGGKFHRIEIARPIESRDKPTYCFADNIEAFKDPLTLEVDTVKETTERWDERLAYNLVNKE